MSQKYSELLRNSNWPQAAEHWREDPGSHIFGPLNLAAQIFLRDGDEDEYREVVKITLERDYIDPETVNLLFAEKLSDTPLSEIIREEWGKLHNPTR